MEHVGYQLINISDDSVLQSWGGVWGQCPGIPSEIRCPNGDIVYAPSVNVEYGGAKLVTWLMSGPPVPQQAPMWAVRTILQNNNLFDKTQTFINASGDVALKNIWEYGNFADRNSRAVNVIAVELSLTDAQIDQMFIDANNISV